MQHVPVPLDPTPQGVRRAAEVRARRAALLMAIAAGTLVSTSCAETFPDRLSAGDTVSTKYGPATVELVENGKAGPVYRLVFDRCDPAMAAAAFDPTADAGAPAPPSLQRQWIWKCRAS